ncbi:WYL domain-containing protein [Succinimonas amylolytica]|uniref:WYL domain-containing protein n=1 Tax=Succinimonas amylolytica TaxID=83769 RepID=UPI00035EC9E4|nr:WYL domain-containing protein [Succinimonas amylolytica]
MNNKFSVKKPGNNKWNQERRLEFIDYRLCWAGHINRADLVSFFGISIPQSSLDLSRYCEMAKDNLKYDRHSKIYRRSPKYKPIYPICASESYLNDILMKAQGTLNPTRDYLEKAPNIACFMPPKRKINFDVLSLIVDCILNQKSVEISYQTMNSVDPEKRRIHPHALGFDGIRWHIRAFDDKHNEFRDFVLSRIYSVGKPEESDVDPNEDMKWNFVVSLKIGPNPKLTPSQQKAIEIDYGMENGEVVYKCRQALLFYTLRLLRLSPDDDVDNDDPKKNQIILKNKDEIFMLLRM